MRIMRVLRQAWQGLTNILEDLAETAVRGGGCKCEHRDAAFAIIDGGSSCWHCAHCQGKGGGA